MVKPFKLRYWRANNSRGVFREAVTGYSTFTHRRAAGEVIARIANTDKVVEVIQRGVPEAPSIPRDSIIRTKTVAVSTKSKPSRIHLW